MSDSGAPTAKPSLKVLERRTSGTPGPRAPKPSLKVLEQRTSASTRTDSAPIVVPQLKPIPLAELSHQARTKVIKETRGVSPTVLLDNARMEVRAAEEHEVKGNLRATFVAYVKAVVLAKMVLELPEAADRKGVVRTELDFFLRYDGAGINARVRILRGILEPPPKIDKGKSKVPPPPLQIMAPIPSTSPTPLDEEDDTDRDSEVVIVHLENTSARDSVASPVPTSPGPSEWSTSTTNNINKNKGTVICKFWKQYGKCTKGNSCNYSHAVQIKPPTPAPAQAAPIKAAPPKAAPTKAAPAPPAVKDQGGAKKNRVRNKRKGAQSSVRQE
ncbi:hypothetical protein BDN70DRAFT_918686 [Pholiota conissans]|uniref:C3H1-type domain-containing protein n=1 Tax=Pholiota conissans TaxID=109636 RepID=A0A9P5Z8I4_9AGAR|nr:hypothetical protein BDN70DRAFT_918686 [Pholiota conissans]